MILFILTFLFPVFVAVRNLIELVIVRERRLHDVLLYSLCQVRDDTAGLAARGELSEKSYAFKLFYAVTASMIHNHRGTGLCFRKLIRRVDESIAKNLNNDVGTKLELEIASGSEELKLIAARFAKTLNAIIRHAYPMDFVQFSWRKRNPEKLKRVCESVQKSAPAEMGQIPAWA